MKDSSMFLMLTVLCMLMISAVSTNESINISFTLTKLKNRTITSPKSHALNFEHNEYKGQQSEVHQEEGSRHMHNLKFIHYELARLQQEHQKQQRQNHHLSRDDSSKDNHAYLLQTYNLKPNIFSFTLPLKVNGLQYLLNIDSGSSDLFIKGQKSKGLPHKKYVCGQKCIDDNPHYKIGYLDGRLETYQAKLPVQLGKHKFNQSMLVAYKVDKNFDQNQGIVGLSFPHLAANPNPTFLQNLINLKIIKHYAFGVNFNFQDRNRSYITLGSPDPQFYQGQLHMIKLTSNLFYYVESKGVSVGNGELLSVNTAIFDTGNTCISIPAKYQKDILKQFNKGEGKKRNQCFFSNQKFATMFSVLKCKVGNFDALPMIHVHMGEKKYSIEKEFYFEACDRRPNDLKKSNSSTDGFWYCDTYIESVSGMPQLFLGDGFFSRYYTYFDIEKQQIGIAKNKEVIKIEKIIQNQVVGDSQDWEQVLKTLNKDQKVEDIKAEAAKISSDDDDKQDDDDQQDDDADHNQQ